MEIAKLNVDSYVLQLNQPLLLKHKFSGKILTASPDFKALCSILSTKEEFYTLLQGSQLTLKQPNLIAIFKLGVLEKSICIEFETPQQDFESQRKDLLDIIERLKKQSEAKSSEIKSLNFELDNCKKSVEALQNYKKDIKNKYDQWVSTHCGGCAKFFDGESIKPYGKAYGRQTCSNECCQYVKNFLGWAPTVDIGL